MTICTYYIVEGSLGYINELLTMTITISESNNIEDFFGVLS